MLKDYILVDTSAWYALFDEDDKHHERANIFYDRNLSPFVTTNFIIDETLTLVKKRLGHRQSVEAGKNLLNQESSSLITITPEDEATAGVSFNATMIKASVSPTAPHLPSWKD